MTSRDSSFLVNRNQKVNHELQNTPKPCGGAAECVWANQHAWPQLQYTFIRSCRWNYCSLMLFLNWTYVLPGRTRRIPPSLAVYSCVQRGKGLTCHYGIQRTCPCETPERADFFLSLSSTVSNSRTSRGYIGRLSVPLPWQFDLAHVVETEVYEILQQLLPHVGLNGLITASRHSKLPGSFHTRQRRCVGDLLRVWQTALSLCLHLIGF